MLDRRADVDPVPDRVERRVLIVPPELLETFARAEAAELRPREGCWGERELHELGGEEPVDGHHRQDAYVLVGEDDLKHDRTEVGYADQSARDRDLAR
ncbi:MAG TPA: hypothetical protein VFC93_05375 [Chloroflexota bacterium]|nr:hypothetical protein [Chloroflexota bacterium]